MSKKSDSKMIYLCLAHMSDKCLEQKYIKEAFDTNWVVPLGPNVDEFENGLKAFLGEGKDIVALSSGTAAMHLALLACGIGAGDEVCVQSLTFCASSNPIAYLGATPVFIDSEKDSWNMDMELLELAIKDRITKTGRKPKAIVPVALYGMPYDCDKIMAISHKYGIPVVEDAAEGFGSRWKFRSLGTFGKFGVLSFNGNKMITTSGGGALVCDGPELKDKIKWYATQAREGYPYYQHEKIGYNYRMSNICAGIGRGQLTVADTHISHHRHVQKLYEELLAGIPGITVHKAPSTDYNSNFWLCTITLDESLRIKDQENAYKEKINDAVGGIPAVIHTVNSLRTDCQPNDNVEALRVFMLSAKVEVRPVWKPMHKQPVYCAGAIETAPGCWEGPKMLAFLNGISESIFKKSVCLPAGPYVTDDDVQYIVNCIKSAIV